MKILFLINEFEKGGAERVVSYLLTHLPKFYPEINPILYLLEKSAFAYSLPENIDIYTGSKYHSSNMIKFLKLPVLALRLKRFIIKNKIQVVISFLNRANYTNILARYLGSDHRCIISERNTSSFVYGTKSVNNRINRLLIHKLYPGSQTIIAVSKGVKNDLVQKFNIPDGKISVIYNPYDIELIRQKSREKLTHKWLDNKEYKILISVARLEKQKNHALLIRSFKLVSDELPETRLLLLGEGRERENLIKLIRSHGLDSKIQILGQQNNPFSFLRRSDLFVLSSDFEGFPNALVESMICGCPVVSTNCKSGPEEIISDGVNGLLVPVGNKIALSNAICEVLKNEKLRLNLKKNALQSIKRFEISNIIQMYSQILVEED